MTTFNLLLPVYRFVPTAVDGRGPSAFNSTALPLGFTVRLLDSTMKQGVSSACRKSQEEGLLTIATCARGVSLRFDGAEGLVDVHWNH